MTAVVLPFPQARRRGQIVRTARYMARIRPEAAERHLQRYCAAQRERLIKVGVPAATAAVEVGAFERAIRDCFVSLTINGVA